jgi:hypothetical protein
MTGILPLERRLWVHDAKTESGRLLASYRHGPYGWYVSVDGKPCEIYLATEDEAQTCLAAVEQALR